MSSDPSLAMQALAQLASQPQLGSLAGLQGAGGGLAQQFQQLGSQFQAMAQQAPMAQQYQDPYQQQLHLQMQMQLQAQQYQQQYAAATASYQHQQVMPEPELQAPAGSIQQAQLGMPLAERTEKAIQDARLQGTLNEPPEWAAEHPFCEPPRQPRTGRFSSVWCGLESCKKKKECAIMCLGCFNQMCKPQRFCNIECWTTHHRDPTAMAMAAATAAELARGNYAGRGVMRSGMGGSLFLTTAAAFDAAGSNGNGGMEAVAGSDGLAQPLRVVADGSLEVLEEQRRQWLTEAYVLAVQGDADGLALDAVRGAGGFWEHEAEAEEAADAEGEDHGSAPAGRLRASVKRSNVPLPLEDCVEVVGVVQDLLRSVCQSHAEERMRQMAEQEAEAEAEEEAEALAAGAAARAAKASAEGGDGVAKREPGTEQDGDGDAAMKKEAGAEAAGVKQEADAGGGVLALVKPEEVNKADAPLPQYIVAEPAPENEAENLLGLLLQAQHEGWEEAHKTHIQRRAARARRARARAMAARPWHHRHGFGRYPRYPQYRPHSGDPNDPNTHQPQQQARRATTKHERSFGWADSHTACEPPRQPRTQRFSSVWCGWHACGKRKECAVMCRDCFNQKNAPQRFCNMRCWEGHHRNPDPTPGQVQAIQDAAPADRDPNAPRGRGRPPGSGFRQQHAAAKDGDEDYEQDYGYGSDDGGGGGCGGREFGQRGRPKPVGRMLRGIPMSFVKHLLDINAALFVDAANPKRGHSFKLYEKYKHASTVCRVVGVWACGRVGVWACGRVGVWACGRVGGCLCVRERWCW
jgi:hypothetical protein